MMLIIVLTIALTSGRRAHARSNLTLGSSMVYDGGDTQAENWLESPGGTFAAGIRKVGRDGWGFAIWYNKLLQDDNKESVVRTFNASRGDAVVWVANRDALMGSEEEARNATVSLTGAGDLVVMGGGKILWRTGTGGKGVAGAALLDTGNLQLLMRPGGGPPAWQSFDHPADTLLPGQAFRPGTTPVRSRATPDLASPGRFSLFFDASTGPNSTLTLAHLHHETPPFVYDAYWPNPMSAGVAYPYNSSTLYTSAANASLDPVGLFNIYSGQGSLVSNYTANDFDYTRPVLRRTVLGSDGNLRTLTWHPPSSTWSVAWTAVTKGCTVHGLCGPFAICSYYPSLSCTCPPGFRMIDTLDPTQGCTHSLRLYNNTSTTSTCPANPANSSALSSAVKMVRILHGDYGYNGLASRTGLSESECAQWCKDNCSCLAAAYQVLSSGNASDSTQCFLRGSSKLESSANISEPYINNGVRSPQEASTLYLKVSAIDAQAQDLVADPNWDTIELSCQPPIVNPPPVLEEEKTRRFLKGGLTAIYALAVGELLCFAAAWACLWRRYDRRARADRMNHASEVIPGVPKRFTFKELEAATAKFSEPLGRGGFGTVYKGVFPDGKKVAVKRLEGLKQGESEFRAEVKIISKIHHLNLVSLLGYCHEGSKHRLLVYEYMPNGSLDQALMISINHFGSKFRHSSHSSHARSKLRHSSHSSDTSSLAVDDDGKPKKDSAIPTGTLRHSSHSSHASSKLRHSSHSSDTSLAVDDDGKPKKDTAIAPGTLDCITSAKDNQAHPFGWAARFRVALGLARGIAYLHEECQEWILHCDIKPQNILLDEKWHAKLADFGLAKLTDRRNLLSVSAIRGTRGYLAPEWLSNRPITAKADVYSFGMVLLEIITGLSQHDTLPDNATSAPHPTSHNGRPPASTPEPHHLTPGMDSQLSNPHTGSNNIPQWCYQQLQAGSLAEVMELQLTQPDAQCDDRGVESNAHIELQLVEVMMKVALWCIQVDAVSRPSMGKVVQMLEGAIPVPDPPVPKSIIAEDHNSVPQSTEMEIAI